MYESWRIKYFQPASLLVETNAAGWGVQNANLFLICGMYKNYRYIMDSPGWLAAQKFIDRKVFRR